MKQYKLTVFLMFSLSIVSGFSQQLPQFTQYMFNTISINPAYAGSRGVLSAVGIHRSQWAGFNEGPQTQTLSVHSPIRNDHMGVGLSFINDKLGYENFTYLYADFSYTINLNEEIKLAFGLKGGFTQYNLDEELLIAEGIDPAINGVRNKWEPNFGTGLLLHTDRWYAGLSAPRLLNIDHNKLRIGEIDYAIVDRVVYFLTGGYVFDLTADTKLKPSFLVKATNGAPVSYDLTSTFLFNEKFWIGGSYRFGEGVAALGAITDFQVSKQFRIGYAYEYPLSDISNYSNGTHEILLLFEFNRLNRVKSPRYF